MMKLMDKTVRGFIAELGAEAPVPGGGSVAALAGACAAALCEMVCRLTLSNARLAETWPAMQEVRVEAVRLRMRLQDLVDEDADAYAGVVAARRLPKGTPGEQAERKAAVQAALLHSARVPLRTLESIGDLSEIVERTAELGNPSGITDAGSAAALVRAGANASAWNVRINLASIVDIPLRDSLAESCERVLARALDGAARAESLVESRLGRRAG
jgi:formiminotetrahydrofolate cyclodeaminase